MPATVTDPDIARIYHSHFCDWVLWDVQLLAAGGDREAATDNYLAMLGKDRGDELLEVHVRHPGLPLGTRYDLCAFG